MICIESITGKGGENLPFFVGKVIILGKEKWLEATTLKQALGELHWLSIKRKGCIDMTALFTNHTSLFFK